MRSGAEDLLFVELGGPGLLDSVHYERLLSERFGLRVGASFFKFYELGDSHASYSLRALRPQTGRPSVRRVPGGGVAPIKARSEDPVAIGVLGG